MRLDFGPAQFRAPERAMAGVPFGVALTYDDPCESLNVEYIEARVLADKRVAVTLWRTSKGWFTGGTNACPAVVNLVTQTTNLVIGEPGRYRFVAADGAGEDLGVLDVLARD